MNRMEANQEAREALRRAAELELRWQDARAQRHRASELFHADLPGLDETDAEEDEDD